jgi:hypothetical protein
MLIYFTGDTDTPASLARQFAGYDHDELAEWIYYANLPTQAHQLMPGTDLYAPQRPVVIPQCVNLSPQEQWWQERILRKVDWLTPPARRNLYRAQQMGLDINRILFSHRKVQQANHDTQDASIGLTQAFQALDVANDLKTERLSKFTEALKAIKSDLHELANATDHAARDIARSRFGQDTLELNKAFHHELVEFELRGKVMLREPLKALKLIKKHGWEIFLVSVYKCTHG